MMVWKPYQCQRCGCHRSARTQDEAAKLMRNTCADQDPPHEPKPRIDGTAERELDAFGVPA